MRWPTSPAIKDKVTKRQPAKTVFCSSFFLSFFQVLTANKVAKKEVNKVWCGKFSVMSRVVLSHIDAWYIAWVMNAPHLASLIHNAQFEPHFDNWCTSSGHKLMPAQHWVILCHNDAWCTAPRHIKPYWCLIHIIKLYWCLMHIIEPWIHRCMMHSHIDA